MRTLVAGAAVGMACLTAPSVVSAQYLVNPYLPARQAVTYPGYGYPAGWAAASQRPSVERAAPVPATPPSPLPSDGATSCDTIILPSNPVVCAPVAVPAVSTDRCWVDGSFLLFFMKDGPLNAPLATTGPGVGVLGAPGTAVRAGGGDVNYGTFTGLRLGAGAWLSDSRKTGLEASAFVLGTRSTGSVLTPSAADVLARPFVDTATAAENVRLLNAPGRFAGALATTSASQLWGAEVAPFYRVVAGPSWTVDVLGGLKYLQLQESLNVFDAAQTLPGGVAAYNGFGVAAPAATGVHDYFGTRNQFYGKMFGGRARYTSGGFFLDLTGKVSLGDVWQVVSVDGTTSLVGGPFVGRDTTPGGLLATAANIGATTRHRFAVMPEVSAQVGYQVTPHLAVFGGYSFLYLSSVVRPGNQIDRTVNPGLVPVSPTYGAAGGPPRPAPQANDTDFWVHGVNVGVRLLY